LTGIEQKLLQQCGIVCTGDTRSGWLFTNIVVSYVYRRRKFGVRPSYAWFLSYALSWIGPQFCTRNQHAVSAMVETWSVARTHPCQIPDVVYWKILTIAQSSTSSVFALCKLPE